MSFARRLTVALTTEADGSKTTYSDPIEYGLLSQIRYVKPGSGGFDNGSTITITTETTGENLWTQTGVNASATVAPRQATHGVDGAASLFAAGGTAAQDKIAMVNDRIKIVIANGGNAKNATFHFLIV